MAAFTPLELPCLITSLINAYLLMAEDCNHVELLTDLEEYMSSVLSYGHFCRPTHEDNHVFL